jgi:uncharacterized protein (DUF362 family)
LGGKTMLYLVDGLYPGEHNETTVVRFASLGDQWAASLFASQDPVAIDSVGLDFLRSEPRETQVSGNAELYWAYFAALTRLFDVMRDVENNR